MESVLAKLNRNEATVPEATVKDMRVAIDLFANAKIPDIINEIYN